MKSSAEGEKRMRNWDDYRYFLAVAEAGTLSAAARALQTTQPTVGRRIRALEERMRVRLFDRLSHGYVLTDIGESVLDEIRRLDQSMLDVERKIAGQDESLAGKVVVTSTEGLAASWLAPRLADFHAAHPDIAVELLIALTPLNLLRREADIALRMGDPQSDQLIGRKVGRVHFGLYAAKSYLKARGRPRKPADLRRHAVIESTGEMAGLKQAETLRAHAKEADVAVSSNNAIAQAALLRAGFGVVPLPCYMAAGAADIERVLPDDFDVSLDLWLLTHRDLRHTGRIRAMLDFLAGAVRNDAEIFTGGR